jgi:hypothetical protein
MNCTHGANFLNFLGLGWAATFVENAKNWLHELLFYLLVKHSKMPCIVSQQLTRMMIVDYENPST